ncbi:hypothetical protein KGF56_002403 [Candida oxycetoniae]|uniref:ethanolamine kinase n=1 Tax=Candida oxycetoniae TaxID=497107 RepID=A0AAI9SXF8_9ASCO|nr:uncharacterized protein KGF56_002403 [Candida oxycetoniae]KAI3404773.2 hypothetical protein KGF56_002403 [Candida oxycetoniae]
MSLQKNKIEPLLDNLQSIQSNLDEYLPAAYCFIQAQKVHFTPIEKDENEGRDDNTDSSVVIALENERLPFNVNVFKNGIASKVDADFLPDKLYLKNKNLLYSLNNPSTSDVETESNGNSLLVPSMSMSTSTSGTLNSDHLNSSLPFDSKSRSRSPSPSPSPPATCADNMTSSLYLPKMVINLTENLQTEFQQLKRLILKVFPRWHNENKLKLKQLTGGITNMLLSCEYDGTTTILIRVYGHGTNLIIDRHREFISHLILNSIGLAPPVYARFKNGLIYGFLHGRSLKPSELSNPRLYPLVAQQLGNWHKSLNYTLIEEGVEKIRALRLSSRRNSFSKKKSSKKKKRFISNIWELIDDWIEIVPVNPELIASFQQHLNIEVNELNLKDVVKGEFHWLQKTLEAVNSPIVSSHCDLLSGNIIVPEDYNEKVYSYDNDNDNDDNNNNNTPLPDVEFNPVKFIDYEYMLPAPRAFDIANHFAEWQGFDCDRSAIPEPSIDNPTIVKFCQGYLNNNDMLKIEELVNEISMFYGLPGFYWGIWAMIQSELSNIDFDYAKYGKSRLQEYWDWKSINEQKLDKSI